MTTTSADKRIDPKLIKTAAVLIVGLLAVVFDTTIVSVALHTLTSALHAPVSTIQWVSTAYLLALGITVPLSSWGLSRFGGKRLWMFSLSIFLVGSIASSLAWNAPSLIAGRVIQGVGGGLMLPVMTTLIMQAAGGKLLGRTVSIIALPALLGPILGPLIGGALVTQLSWRWMFWINIPFCVVGLVLAAIYLVDDKSTARPRFDTVGLLLLAPGIAALILGLSNVVGEGGFTRPDVMVPLLLGAALVAAFTLYAVRRAQPLVDVRLLRRRSVASASGLLFFSGFALYGVMLLLPLFYQEVHGMSALGAGLMLVPQGVGALLSRSLAGSLTDKLGARAIAVAGFVVVALGTLPFAFADAQTNGWLLAVLLVVRGFGLGAVTIPVMSVAYIGLERDEIAQSSVVTRVAQQIGGSFGTAVLAVLLEHEISVHGAAGSAGLITAFEITFWWATGFTLIAAALAFTLPRSPARTAQPTT